MRQNRNLFSIFLCCRISFGESRSQSGRDTAVVRLVDVFDAKDNRGHKS